jgi:hypothetical protein
VAISFAASIKISLGPDFTTELPVQAQQDELATVKKSLSHKFALSFRLSGEQKAQNCDEAWLQNLSRPHNLSTTA